MGRLFITGPVSAGATTTAPVQNGEAITTNQVKTLLGIASNDSAASTVYVDGIAKRANLKWAAGFTGLRCWQTDENGRPVDYHASPTSTEAERAATVPGTNGSVWVVTQEPGDPVNSYTTARDS